MRITEIQRGGQLQSKELDSMLKTLEGMENKFHSSFEGINNDIQLLDREVNENGTRFNRFVELVLNNFDNLQEGIMYEIKKRKGEFEVDPFGPGLAERKMAMDSVECIDIGALCTIDTQKPTNVEILKEIKEKIDEIDKTVVEKCKAISKALQQARERSQRQGDKQDSQRNNVQQRFHEHEEFIRTNLLKSL